MDELFAATQRVAGVERDPLVPIRTEEELDAATLVGSELRHLNRQVWITCGSCFSLYDTKI